MARPSWNRFAWINSLGLNRRRLEMGVAAGLVLLLVPAGIAYFAREAAPARPTVYPVSGRLLVNGQPAPDAMIAFHPRSASLQALPPFRAVAATGADGRFTLMTYTAADGAPAGDYAVTVLWLDRTNYDECGDPLPHDRLRGQYFDPDKTPLRVTIAPGTNDVPLAASMSIGNWNTPRLRDQVKGHGS